MIRVLVVDDSTFMQKVISDMIGRGPEITVVATAGDGREALDKVIKYGPDVVTIDIMKKINAAALF